ncbi:hypothetical protein ACFE04_028862 [Oxalis oulophora]
MAAQFFAEAGFPYPQTRNSSDHFLRCINSDFDWWDLFAVMVILIVYRFLFFAILKIKEKALPFVQTVYAKRAVQLLSKKASFRQASFRKIPSFPSPRNEPQHMPLKPSGTMSFLYIKG